MGTKTHATVTIDRTSFGDITIDGQTYDHDVLIRLDGSIEKRKKKLSKKQYGTSHVVSLGEAEHVYEDGARLLVVGSGQTGCVELSAEAAEFFADRGVKVIVEPTPKAIKTWNHTEKPNAIGLFHVTC